MNEPITWGDYFLFRMLAVPASIVLSLAFYCLVALSDARYCRKCGHGMQWRWRKPSQFSKHRWCVFCEEDQF